jgi:predicted transposase YbfD/YdcC
MEEKNRGRLERRTVSVFVPSSLFPLPKEWESVQRIIRVNREFQSKNTLEKNTSYYISSVSDDRADFFGNGIRGHWSIENRLHYVKDVNLHEDTSGIKNSVAASNLSILKNMAINIVRQNHGQSIKNGAIFFASNVKKLLKIVVG